MQLLTQIWQQHTLGRLLTPNAKLSRAGTDFKQHPDA